MKKAFIAMSGGVDSSVTALLMQKEGYECIGATMHLFYKEGSTDIADARAVCDRLGMEHVVLNYSAEFEKEVIRRFIESYERGDTPNPCLDCNKYLKFGLMLESAKEHGCDVIATGHYARIEEKDGKYLLKKAADPAKDQSYVLYSLTQNQLRSVRFPLGEMSKEEARALAEENGFLNAKRADSQDICFVPEGDYASVIEQKTGKTYPEGDFIDLNGKVLGRHKGIIRYTIGQRKGLGLALPEPMYVGEKRVDTCQVVLCRNDELFKTELIAEDFNWISGETPTSPVKANAKVRYRHTEQPATITDLGEGKVKVVFDRSVRAITKGQAVVVYVGDVVLGGGIIA